MDVKIKTLVKKIRNVSAGAQESVGIGLKRHRIIRCIRAKKTTLMVDLATAIPGITIIIKTTAS